MTYNAITKKNILVLNARTLKNILTICAVLFASGLKAQTSTYNYVRTRLPRIKIASSARLDQLTPVKDSVETTIEYSDGLGRPLQTVQMQSSPTGKDIIQPFGYDRFSRDTVKYLAYTVGAATPGVYQPNAIAGANGTYATSNQYTFYQQTGQGYINTQYPYSGINFEASPLNRPVEQGLSGADWQLSTAGVSTGGHTRRMDYASNDQGTAFVPTTLTNNPGCRTVAFYTATINSDQSRSLTRIGNNATYSPQQLVLTVTKDENWNAASDGCLGITEGYSDKEGHAILKRTYNRKGNVLEMLSTYYIYDDRGNLCFVLPPGANPDATAAMAQTTLDNLCYQYRYDERNRLTQKKLPRKAWEYIVYNYIDQPVATQDSVERASNQWIFTKYDGLGRIVMTGIWNNGGTNGTPISRASLQAILTGISTNLWEVPAIGGNGYSSVAWPTTNITATLSLNYYDGYTAIPSLPATYSAPTGYAPSVRGVVTGKKVTVLNTLVNSTPDVLWNVFYYDDLGKNIKTYTQHYLGAVLNTNNYDATTTGYNFTNQPTVVIRQHWNTASTSTPLITMAKTYIYDHMGRKLKTWEQITCGSTSTTKTLLSKNVYNETGQLWNKYLHSTDSINFLQNVTYTYNERGWMLSETSPLFTEQLQYNTGANKAWNGNIMYQTWASAASNNSFSYSYDRLNRLASGQSADNKYIERGITYDQLGNIATLSRMYNGILIDSLSYNYLVNANPTDQLQSITDKSTDAGTIGYKTGTSTYTYDVNGNMVTDNSKGFSIVYNLLNLPQSIAAKSTTYTYDASGQKIRRVIGTFTTDYIGGIEYDGGSVAFAATDEGRVLINTSTATVNYEYSLNDHLGNTRLTFDSASGSARTEQQDNYMPFGLDITVGSIGSPQNYYLYNKKELQSNLQLYDYGARFYDPIIGRWTKIDNKTESFENTSPYVYAVNDPVNAIDPDGNLIIFVNGFVPDQYLNQDNHTLVSEDRIHWYPNPKYRPYPGDRGLHPAPTYLGRAFSYWQDEFGDAQNAFVKGFAKMQGYTDPLLFINASSQANSQAQDRFKEGEKAGEDLIAQLASGKIKLKDGETIKIVSHSQGGAFAAGMATVLSKNATYASVVQVVIYLEPHEPADFNHPANIKGVQISSPDDLVASKNPWIEFLDIPIYPTSKIKGKTSYSRIKGVQTFIPNLTWAGDLTQGHSVGTNLDEIAQYFRSLGIPVTIKTVN